MNKNEPVHFKYGSIEQFNTLQRQQKIEDNTIYFISDDTNHTNRIYLGRDCFNVETVDTMDVTGKDSAVPQVKAVREALSNKVSRCKVLPKDDTTLPDVVELANDTEIRFLELTGTTPEKLHITIPYKLSEINAFYCSIILKNVRTDDVITDFVDIVTQETDYADTIRFLNGDVSLSGKDVVELLFFYNGISICCIASAYSE